VVARRAGEALISREQRRVERFREGDVDGVICGEIVSQIPHPREKEIVRIATERQVGQVFEGGAASPLIDFTSHCIPADNLRDFNIDQMGGMQGLSRGEQPPAHRFCGGSAQQRFEQR